MMNRETRSLASGAFWGVVVGAVVAWCFVQVCGCTNTTIDLGADASDPCDPSQLACVYGEDGYGVPRCCLDGPNCIVWDEAGELVCAPWAEGLSTGLPSGAVVTCGPGGAAECVP